MTITHKTMSGVVETGRVLGVSKGKVKVDLDWSGIKEYNITLFDTVCKIMDTDAVMTKALNKLRRKEAKSEYVRKKMGASYGYDSFFDGAWAEDIDSCSREDWWEAVGYIAKNCTAIEAQIADFKVELFEDMFGSEAKPYIHKSGDIGSRFRICFDRTENMPKILESCLSIDGRITKSLFIEKIIKVCGFKFGTEQNIEAIRTTAVENGFGTEFNRGFSL